jgi:hypothetical protein
VRIELRGTNLVAYGDSWKGEGSFDGRRGFYDWKFNDGKIGRTDFYIIKNGMLYGMVRGSGINWDYQATRQ